MIPEVRGETMIIPGKTRFRQGERRWGGRGHIEARAPKTRGGRAPGNPRRPRPYTRGERDAPDRLLFLGGFVDQLCNF
jgi:hypothetical protein